jgi:hypothetical protein
MSESRSAFVYGFEPGEGDFVARVPAGINTREELFDALHRALHFPSYFGRNWDALYELLRDLHWIPEKRVVILHAELPSLPPEQLGTYLSIVEDSIADWKPEEDHELVVGFPEEARERLRAVGY